MFDSPFDQLELFLLSFLSFLREGESGQKREKKIRDKERERESFSLFFSSFVNNYNWTNDL